MYSACMPNFSSLEEYPDEILSAEQAAHIRILGWVFWWSTVRRRRGLSLAR